MGVSMVSLAFCWVMGAGASQSNPRNVPQLGAKPREVLSPATIEQLTKSPIQQLVDRVETVEGRSTRVLSNIQQQHAYLLEQQRAILEELRAAAGATDRLGDIEQRLRASEAALHRLESSNEATQIAVLQSKMDGILKAVSWILGAVGSLVMGMLGLMVRRLYAGWILTGRQQRRHRETC